MPCAGGPSLANDIIIQTGQTLFGQTVTSLGTGGSNVSNAPTGTFGGSAQHPIYLQLTGWHVGHCHRQQRRHAGRIPLRWRLGTASNWLPAIVPDAATETLFDLDASYDVTVGTRPSGRQCGSGFRRLQSANLTPGLARFRWAGQPVLRCPTAQ
ncbi:MAG: hypothetical protein IPH82_02675 [Chloroflexi bacterium]|nr:hypothetical protein [Chloroflexota bacterium]